MILRRLTEHVKAQNWFAVGIDFLIVVVGVFGVGMIGMPRVAAEQFPSDEIPQAFLDACDARAMPYGAYDPVVQNAVDALVAMGVFSEEEFSPVTIGFCDLRSVQGPVATTSCGRNSILLDSGYLEKDQSLVLRATMAHEMKHHLQHNAQKAKFDGDYCASAQYLDDKTWMEEEADIFGDEVAALFFVGRPVEIINECAAEVSIYLEADNPISTSDDALTFTNVPPQAKVSMAERAVSKFFKLYAKAVVDGDRQKIWGEASMANQRRIDGDVYGLQNVTLPSVNRSNGPFQMTLACDD